MTSWLFADKGCTCGVAPALPQKPVENTPQEQGHLQTVELDDKYEMLGELGKGGVGTVFRVRDRISHKEFALKMLQPEYVKERAAIKRFELEAMAARALMHPNLVEVHDYGRTALGAPFILMSFVNGQSLADVLAQEMYLKPSRVVEIFLQACDALAYAHENGVVHRDIKPGNIILERGDSARPLFADYIKIVDFGIAKVTQGITGDTSQLTQTGEIFGSPLYMSPEQCTGARIDARSDIYSLGCVMYECLTGVNPFAADNPVQIILKQLHDSPPPFRKASPSLKIPHAFETVVLGALAKEPQARYQSMRDVASDLMLIQEGKQPQGPKALSGAKLPASKALGGNRIGIMLLVLNTILAGFVVWFVMTRNQAPTAPASSQPVAAQEPLDAMVQTADKSLALMEDQTKAAVAGPPFAAVPMQKATPPWQFEFLPTVSLGRIVQSGSFKSVTAVRRVSFPAVRPLYLNASAAVLAQPKILQRFRDDELYGFCSASPFDDRVLNAVKRFTGLKELLMPGADITRQGLEDLKSLRQLATVDVSRTKLTNDAFAVLGSWPGLRELTMDELNLFDDDLAKMAFLSRLSVLRMSHFKNVSRTLKSLQSSRTLSYLKIQDDNLTDQDLATVAGIKSLRAVDIGYNKQLHASALHSLAALPELSVLHIAGCKMSPAEALPEVRKLNGITTLVVDRTWTEAQLNAIRLAMPKLSVQYESDAIDTIEAQQSIVVGGMRLRVSGSE